MDRGAWQATVHSVTKSQTWLKQLSTHIWHREVYSIPCDTILDAWGWCTGMTQRDGMGREEGGGFRMGNTCVPVADSF